MKYKVGILNAFVASVFLRSVVCRVPSPLSWKIDRVK